MLRLLPGKKISASFYQSLLPVRVENNYDIVFLIARFWPYKGGAEQNCYYLARHAQAAGLRVAILTTDVSPDGLPLAPVEEIEGITILRVHAWNQQLNLGFYPQLLGKLLNLNARIIHVCNGPGFIWRDFCLFTRKLLKPQTKIIITPHGGFLATPQTHSGLKYLVAITAKKLMGVYFHLFWSKLFTKVIAVNSHQQTWLTHDFGFKNKQIVLLPNGIPETQIIKDLSVKPQREKLNVVYLGRWEKYKGIQTVIKAFAAIFKANTLANMHLRILGNGIYENDLRRLTQSLHLQKHVDFIKQPSDELRDTILQESDIIVLLSQWEATGIVLLEGMAKGCIPITTFGNEAHAELINNGIDGFTMQTEDVDGLVKILTDVNEDRAQLNEMKQKALEKASSFTWEEISIKYIELLKTL